MPVTQYYPVGAITVPSSWIALIVGFVMTYLFIRIYFGKILGERIGNIFFNMVIIWKFSVILTDFSTVRHYPLSILYFHGGTFGWLLALLIVGVLTIRQGIKEKWTHRERWMLLLALISWQTVYQVMMTFLNEGSLQVKWGTIAAFLGLWILTFWSYRKTSNTVSELSAIWLAVHFMVSAFQPGAFWNIPLITTISGGLLIWRVQRLAVDSVSREEEVI
ncbi:hypothetical protein [Sporosarcina obsidiansis]|uniref:hypothetical protein n=1 Tax=Sporosarcina obsidiansis TaxID=2660748 RepID=UPI00129AFF95|nr:hypothetical protein [Sporosarcina obsidiansis]